MAADRTEAMNGSESKIMNYQGRRAYDDAQDDDLAVNSAKRFVFIHPPVCDEVDQIDYPRTWRGPYPPVLSVKIGLEHSCTCMSAHWAVYLCR